MVVEAVIQRKKSYNPFYLFGIVSKILQFDCHPLRGHNWMLLAHRL